MEKIICFFRGHKWGKMKRVKGWTTENSSKCLAVKTTHFRQVCKCCGIEEYYSISSTI